MKRKVYRLDTSDNTHRDFDVNKARYIYGRDLLQFRELFVVHYRINDGQRKKFQYKY